MEKFKTFNFLVFSLELKFKKCYTLITIKKVVVKIKKSNTAYRLKQLMIKKDLRQIDILNACKPFCNEYNVKFNKSDISQYVSGKSEPNQDKLYILSKALNVNPVWLMGYDVPKHINESNPLNHNIKSKSSDENVSNILSLYNQLNNENKTATYDYASNLLDKQNIVKEDVSEYYAVKTVEKVAAGVGYSYNSCNEYKTYYSHREPKQHDMATKIVGNSMSPKYKDGDIILVKNGYDNVEGAVYVIDYDGKSFVKRVYNEGNRFKMVSINPQYEPFYIDVPVYDDIYFNIVGKVIDSFTPINMD